MTIKHFLFGPHPLYLETFDRMFFIDSAVAFVVGLGLAILIMLKSFNPVSFKLLRRFKNLTLTYGFLGLIWTGFRYENAAYLSWRLWAVIIAAVGVVWLVKIIVYVIKNYRLDLDNWRKQEVKQKYLNAK